MVSAHCQINYDRPETHPIIVGQEIYGVGPAEYTVIEQFCEDFGLKPRFVLELDCCRLGYS